MVDVDFNAWCEIDGRCPGSYHERYNHTLIGWTLEMLDPDTFLTGLYVMVDECCKTSLPPEPPPGPQAPLSRREGRTWAIVGQWGAFGSERGWYRYAQRRLRPAFPPRPTRAQCNRQVRRHHAAVVARGR